MERKNASMDGLLHVLGNKTRRRILRLLAQEPKYLLELSKELDVSPPALQKHLEVLEKNGFITTFRKESELGAPPRKYFQPKSSVYLSASITSDFFNIDIIPLPLAKIEEVPEEVKRIENQMKGLQSIKEPNSRLRQSSELLSQIDGIVKKFDETKAFLLSLRQRVQRIANETIREISETNLKRKILYTMLDRRISADTGLLSVELDVRERTIEEALSELERKGVLPLRKKPEPQEP